MCTCIMIDSIFQYNIYCYCLLNSQALNNTSCLSDVDWCDATACFFMFLHMYDHDHMCVTGVHCLKKKKEWDRERWVQKSSVQGPCVGERCFAQTLEAYQQSSHCFSVSSQLYRTEAVPLLFPLLLHHHNSNCQPFYCLPILLSSCPLFWGPVWGMYCWML